MTFFPKEMSSKITFFKKHILRCIKNKITKLDPGEFWLTKNLLPLGYTFDLDTY